MKLLMLGTSKGSVEMLKAAKKGGDNDCLITVVTDPREPKDSKAKQISDDYWMIDITDTDALVKKCIDEKIDGVCSGLSTFCQECVKDLCEKLNLPTYWERPAWHYAVDKYDFKALCRKHGVPVAKDYFVSNPPVEDEIDKINLPVMVKAVNLSSNMGMSYCYKKEEILPAIEFAQKSSGNDKIVIERMLHGTQYTAYYAVADGILSLVNLYCNLHEEGTPGKCYAINMTAADKLDLYLKEVDPFWKKAAESMGIRDGVVWIEMLLDEDGHFYVIEMGHRMTGDMMAIPLKDVTGFDSYSWLVDIAMGEKHSKSDLPIGEIKSPKKCGCSYIMWSKNKTGKVAEIKGLEKIKAIRGVTIHPEVPVGCDFRAEHYMIIFTFTRDSIDEICDIVETINKEVSILDEQGEDVLIRYTDFNKIKEIYTKSLEG